MTADVVIGQVLPGGNALFLAVMAAVTTWLLLRSFLRRGAGGGRLNPPQQPARGTPLVDSPRDISRWQVEMHDLARDLSAQLDSKMGALQHLIRQAAEESERLERAIAAARERNGK